MFPERIVCLSSESADICAQLGAAQRVVAVSAYAPKELRIGRKVVGGFSTFKRDDVIGLEPDLVITFSDVQAEISAELIRYHCTVLATNQRSLRQIGETILLIGRAIGCEKQAASLANHFTQRFEKLRSDAEPRARVYFEEWNDPLISGIGWVSEAIELAGGYDIFRCEGAHASRDRQVDPDAVCAADPEIIFASWCGKPVALDEIRGRPGWNAISAVRTNNIHVLDSDDILQPGPAVLRGISKMRAAIDAWRTASGTAPAKN